MSKESKLLQRNKSELFSLIRNLPTLGDTLIKIGIAWVWSKTCLGWGKCNGKLNFSFICLIFNCRVLISSLNSCYHLIYLSHPLWKCIMLSVYFFRKYPNIQNVMKFNERIIPFTFIWDSQLAQCILVVIYHPISNLHSWTDC